MYKRGTPYYLAYAADSLPENICYRPPQPPDP